MEVMLLQQCYITGPKCHLLLISIPIRDTRYPIPDIRCRYLIRFSLCYYSNAVSLDLNAICSRYRYRYAIPAVDTLPDVPFSILQFAYLDCFPPPLLHCSQGMVLLAALYSATFGPARKLFAPWMKAGKSPPWKTVGEKKESNMDKKLTIIKQQLWERF